MSPPLPSVEHLDLSHDGAVQALRDVSREFQAGSVTGGTIRYQGTDPSATSYTFG